MRGGHQKSAKPKRSAAPGDRDVEAARIRGARSRIRRCGGNRHVERCVTRSGSTVAAFQYDAFGNTIAQSGTMTDSFAYRFNTKYWDAEAGLYYYGYRYYRPGLGRWVNRDPIGEYYEKNLYVFVDKGALIIMMRWSRDVDGVLLPTGTTPLGWNVHGATWNIHDHNPWSDKVIPIHQRRGGWLEIRATWDRCKKPPEEVRVSGYSSSDGPIPNRPKRRLGR